MGVARLLAKGWVVFCLFAGGHGALLALSQGTPPAQAFEAVAVCVGLFGAMGLLFIAGFGASSTGSTPLLARLRPHHLIPSFDDVVFVAFVAVSFAAQAYFISEIGGGAAGQAVQKAMYVVVPGLRALGDRLAVCGLNAPLLYSITLTAAVAWLLAIVFVASAVSRLGLAAGLIRLERTLRPAPFGLTLLAAIYGILSIVGIQLLYVGSVFPWLGCGAFNGIDGVVLSGLAPLFLAYVIVAALTTLKASAPEG